MPTVGWGAVIQGEPMDLAAWGYALKERFDLWVEIHGSATVLRWTSFDELSGSEVRNRAIAYIDRLNGAMALSHNARPVQFGGVIRFEPKGPPTQFLEPQLFKDRDFFMSSTVTAIGLDGQPVPPPPPQPSEVQRWAMLADNEILLDDALIYFGRGTDWFDVYKVLECLILRFGEGNEAAFLALNWAPDTEVQRLKRTANWSRHARGKFERPPDPMELEEARGFVGRLLRRALAEAAK
jgi:hypothetical protein